MTSRKSTSRITELAGEQLEALLSVEERLFDLKELLKSGDYHRLANDLKKVNDDRVRIKGAGIHLEKENTILVEKNTELQKLVRLSQKTNDECRQLYRNNIERLNRVIAHQAYFGMVYTRKITLLHQCLRRSNLVIVALEQQIKQQKQTEPHKRPCRWKCERSTKRLRNEKQPTDTTTLRQTLSDSR